MMFIDDDPGLARWKIRLLDAWCWWTGNIWFRYKDERGKWHLFVGKDAGR